MSTAKEQRPVENLDDLDAGWQDEVAASPGLDELDSGWDQDDAEDEGEEQEPEPPSGLAPAEREALMAARKERARAKALSKKERRKARKSAADAKQKVKRGKKGGPPPNGSTRAARRPEATANRPSDARATPRSTGTGESLHARTSQGRQRGAERQRMIVVVLAVLGLLGAAVAFFLKH